MPAVHRDDPADPALIDDGKVGRNDREPKHRLRNRREEQVADGVEQCPSDMVAGPMGDGRLVGGEGRLHDPVALRQGESLQRRMASMMRSIMGLAREGQGKPAGMNSSTSSPKPSRLPVLRQPR